MEMMKFLVQGLKLASRLFPNRQSYHTKENEESRKRYILKSGKLSQLNLLSHSALLGTYASKFKRLHYSLSFLGNRRQSSVWSQMWDIIQSSISPFVSSFQLSNESLRFDNLSFRFDNLSLRFDNLSFRFDNLSLRFDSTICLFVSTICRFDSTICRFVLSLKCHISKF